MSDTAYCMDATRSARGRLKMGRILDAGAMTDDDRRFLGLAFEQAKLGYDGGGCPIDSVLAEGDHLITAGRNRRVQQDDPIAHGEMDFLRNAGRQKSYRRMTLYTSLSPCTMSAGTIGQLAIPRVVVGEAENFAGNLEFLVRRGVDPRSTLGGFAWSG
jgi:creatinine deaminase